MDPTILSKDESDGYKLTDEKIEKILAYWHDSASYRDSVLIPRFARNQRLMKGVPVESESPTSKVTGKNKLYYRKIWSSAVRLLASMFQAYLQDKNKFKLLGRDEQQDYQKAKVLEIMTRYRFELMMRRRSLFLKILWAFFDLIGMGFVVCKQTWKHNEELGIDEPDFNVYPAEQVCLDWPELASGDINNMRFAMFENWYTLDMMEDMGYEKIKDLPSQVKPQNELEQARYQDSANPLVSSGTANESTYSNSAVGNAYPQQGSQPHEINPYLRRYLCLEAFYKEKGKMYYCVIHPDTKTVLFKAILSPYGQDYPISVGSMIPDPHKAVPEGLPEVLEGPQESLNLTLNLRKDNVMLAMNGGFIYSRFGNVDKQSLRNIKPGFTVAADDVNAVKELKVPDVTQTSYIEAGQYVGMIDEMSAVNPTKQGQSNVQKATVAQINLTEANAKHDLFVAVAGQTFFHQFVYNLAKHISMFETDERIFRVANETFRKEPLEGQPYENVYDLEFDFDIEVNAGLSEVSRGIRSQQISAAIQTALQSNNSTILMLKSGIKIDNPKIFNTGEMQAELLPELGLPNLSKYMISVTPPPPEQPQQAGQGSAEGGEQSQVAEGQNAPQANEEPEFDPEFMQSLMGGG